MQINANIGTINTNANAKAINANIWTGIQFGFILLLLSVITAFRRLPNYPKIFYFIPQIWYKLSFHKIQMESIYDNVKQEWDSKC